MRLTQRTYYQITNHYAGSLSEWWNFKYAPLPNEFTKLILVILGSLLFFDIVIGNPQYTLLERLTSTACMTVVIDVALYWCFCLARFNMAFRLYRRDLDWKNIRPGDVEMN